MSDGSEHRIDLRALLRRSAVGRGEGSARATGFDRLRLWLDLPSDTGVSRPPATGREQRRLGRYEITGELGHGGVGLVSLAVDRDLGREVAVKMLLHPDSVKRAQVERFVQEARVTAKLEHPSVVPVYEIGVTDDGDLYYTMKRVDGVPLSRVISGLRRREPRYEEDYPPATLLRIFAGVCQAAAYAHDRGVAHGDIKPDNVMLGAYGEVLLMDWGFATLIGVDDLSSLRHRFRDRPAAPSGGVFGTPGYLAPERIVERTAPTPASDVYALGCVLYEILTLRRPFQLRDRDALLQATVESRPVPPDERAPGRRVAQDLGELCLSCLEHDPARRAATPKTVASAVDAYLAGSRQREECERRIKQGHVALQRHIALRERLGRARALTAEIERRIEAWRPLEDKGPLMEGLRTVDQLRQATADAYAEAATAFDSALNLDAADADARSGMADVYWLRFEEVEARADARELALAERQLMAYDDGRYAVRIQGEAALTLDSEPTHAEVILLRYERRARIVTAVPFQDLPRTPLRLIPLPTGSYLLVLRAEGYRTTRYPLEIRRREHFNPSRPVRMLKDDSSLEGFVHVPAGRFRCGGDPESPGALPPGTEDIDDFLIGRFPVSAGAYATFLDDVWRRDPAEARQRAPRQTGVPGMLWEEDEEGWHIPSVDRNGNRWAANHPVYGVSWLDAEAFAAWLSARHGISYSLPSELEWEKAMRGADARHHPWGDWFDASLCSMRDTHPTRPCNRPAGLFPMDVSPYGVHDAAGGVQEWCHDRSDRESGLRRQRGGAWCFDRRYSRLANRRSNFAWNAELSSGFRLCRRLPDPDP